MVSQPHPNDVLFGRGGGTNHHLGNKMFRKMVEERKPQYVIETRCGKPKLAREIIEWVRYSQDPPGRFLKYADNDGAWRDVGDKKAREKTSQALREKTSNLPHGHSDEDDGVDLITGPNQDSDASTTRECTLDDGSATTKEEEWHDFEEQKIDDTYLDPKPLLCEPVPKFAYANSYSIDDLFDSHALPPPLHIPTISSSVDDHASGRMHSLMDENHPLGHAENEFADWSGRETEARNSSFDDQASGRMHSLMDVNHPLPHAEIEFADPFGRETEANTLKMLCEKRETSHENENLETRKRGCKLSRCPAESFMTNLSQSMDLSSFRNQRSHLGFLSKGLSNMSLDYNDNMSLLAGSKAPSLASMSVPSMRNINGDADRDTTFLTFSSEYMGSSDLKLKGADSRQSTFDENIFETTPLDFASASS